MNLLGAKINEPPNNLRAILSIGSFLKSVLDHADNNARAKVEMGQEPDLLEDVMAGGKIHIPNSRSWSRSSPGGPPPPRWSTS